MLKRISLLLSTSLLLQACSSVPGVVEQPKLSVQNIQLQDISLTQGTAVVTLNVFNPNAFPLPLEGVEYGLRLNGSPVASGTQNQPMHIGAQQQVPLQIPVKLNFSELAKLVPNAIQSKRVDYDLSGAVRLPLVKIPFHRQGGVGVGR